MGLPQAHSAGVARGIQATLQTKCGQIVEDMQRAFDTADFHVDWEAALRSDPYPPPPCLMNALSNEHFRSDRIFLGPN